MTFVVSVNSSLTDHGWRTLTLLIEASGEPASKHQPSSQVQRSLPEVGSVEWVSAPSAALQEGCNAPSRQLGPAAP